MIKINVHQQVAVSHSRTDIHFGSSDRKVITVEKLGDTGNRVVITAVASGIADLIVGEANKFPKRFQVVVGDADFGILVGEIQPQESEPLQDDEVQPAIEPAVTPDESEPAAAEDPAVEAAAEPADLSFTPENEAAQDAEVLVQVEPVTAKPKKSKKK